MCKYFPRLRYDSYPLHSRGLGLCLCSALVCDLLPRRLFHGSPQAHCRRVSQSQFWRALCGWHWAYLVPFLIGHATAKGLCPRAAARHVVTTKSGQVLHFFPPTCGGRKSAKTRLETVPSGGHHSLGATFLGSWGDWLWELVSPRIHASPPTLWTVVPSCRGLERSALNLGRPLVLRSGTVSWF